MSRTSKPHILTHRLVARAFQVADEAGARRILLASAYDGDGKSHFAECILRHSKSVTDQPVDIIKLETLKKVGWLPEGDHGYVWADGLSVLEGEGPSILTPAVRGSLDGAILVARGMGTTRADLEECAERLRILGVRLLGGVWNERDHPPAAQALSRMKGGFRKRRSWFFLNSRTRQPRRSP